MHVISPEISVTSFPFYHLLAGLWHRRRACHRPIDDLDRASRLLVFAGETDLGTPRVIFEFSVLLLCAFRLAAQSGITGKVSLQHRLPPQEKHKASLSRHLCDLSSLLHLAFYRRVWSVLCRGSGPDGGVQCGALGAAAWRAPGGRRRRKAGVLAMSESRGRVWRAR